MSTTLPTAALAPPADPAQTPASSENDRPDFAVIFQITTDATKNDIWSGWVGDPGQKPMLFGAFSAEWADPGLAEAIITMRHGKPRRIAVIDFDAIHTLEQAEAAATEAASALGGAL